MMQALPLAGRYRFLKRLSAGPPRTVWLAEDVSSAMMVVAVRLAPRFGQQLAPVIRVQHPHLACLLDIVRGASRDELPEGEADDPNSPIAVAEWVSGQTLHDALMRDPIPSIRAVQTVAYIASAVAALHAKKAFHGAISARSVVIERSDDGPGPVLTQVIMPPDGSYASPERLAGKGPGPADDVWALHVLLYAALTGQRPFRARTRVELLKIVENPPVPVEAFGVIDTKLQRILDMGFAKETSLRTSSIQALETELFTWLSACSAQQPVVQASIEDPRAADTRPARAEIRSEPAAEAPTVMTPAPVQEALASLTAVETPRAVEAPREVEASPVQEAFGGAGQPAAPLFEPIAPATQAPLHEAIAPAAPAARAQTAQRPEPSHQVWPAVAGVVALLTVLAAAGAGYFFVIRGDTAATTPPSAPRPLASEVRADPVSTPSALPSASSPATADQPRSAPAGVTSCVANHFDPATFAIEQNLAFVCEQADPRKGAATMRTKIVLGGAGKLTEGMNMWPRLGWHELLVYGILRRKCCAGGPPIELPAPGPRCASLQESINTLSSAVAGDAAELGSGHESFVEAATCALISRDRAYRYPTGPLSGGQLSYEVFVRRNLSP